MLAHKFIRYAGEAIERILDSITKQLSAEQVVINRHAERELHVCLTAAMPEMQVVLPARIEKFPLQVGHLDQFGAIFLLHARVLERYKERRHECALRIAQIVKEVERFL